jgi:peptidoglycan-associated lipoprotein
MLLHIDRLRPLGYPSAMTIRTASLVASCFVLALFLGGCPKRPIMPVAQAPPPTVAAPPPPPAPPPPAPPPAPAPAPAPAPVAPAPPPPAAPAPPKEYRAHSALKEIRFDFDRSTIRPGDARILDSSADWLKANPTQIVLIEGHCDDRGTSEYNMALGERRARAAAEYLSGKGIEAGRLLLISYGKERPACEEKTEACRAANRRDVFLVKEK